MKEELLEAIYGTVERLEQKVDELSVSTKNAGAKNVPASNDITKPLGVVSLPLACSLHLMPKLTSHSQRMNPLRRKRGNAERASAFDASYKLKIRIEHERRTIGSHLQHS